MVRTFEESCAYLDEIVGRCVRDAAFSDHVLSDPEAALADYGLSVDEMDDFRALRDRHFQETRLAWATLRVAVFPVPLSGTGIPDEL